MIKVAFFHFLSNIFSILAHMRGFFTFEGYFALIYPLKTSKLPLFAFVSNLHKKICQKEQKMYVKTLYKSL